MAIIWSATALGGEIPDADLRDPSIAAGSDIPGPHTSDDLLERAHALAVATLGTLTRELSGATRDVALELAESVEVLGRQVDHLRLVAARAVEESAPAPSPSSALLVDHSGELGQVDAPDDANESTKGTEKTKGRKGKGQSANPGSPFATGRDLLRVRLRISGADASRRIRLARHVLPRTTLTGDDLPPVLEHTGAVIHQVNGDAVGHILRATTRITKAAGPEAARQVEASLSHHALTFDPDSIKSLADRAIILLDPDGPEPSEIDFRQGAFIGSTHGGLTTIKLVVDALQREILTTIFNAGTNPRSRQADGSSDHSSAAGDGESPVSSNGGGTDGLVSGSAIAVDSGVADHTEPDAHLDDADLAALAADTRSRARKMLDALISASQAALRTRDLPQTGGLPTQVMVTMQLDDLLTGLAQAGRGEQIAHLAGNVDLPLASSVDRPLAASDAEPSEPSGPFGEAAPPPHPPIASATALEPGEIVDPDPPDLPRKGALAYLPYAGPVPLHQVRRLACDADLIPVVLATNGRLLDLGREHRLFPPHLRKALIARDKGCTYPGCPIPATWCEGHHVIPWHLQGPTKSDLAVLLCSGHHHLIHQQGWTVQLRGDKATFLPPWAALPRLTTNPYRSGTVG